MLGRTLKIIKVLIKIIMVVVVEPIALLMMFCTFAVQPYYPDLGEFGFCVSFFINGFNSILHAKKSRILWFVHILLVTAFCIVYSHVRTIWQTP